MALMCVCGRVGVCGWVCVWVGGRGWCWGEVRGLVGLWVCVGVGVAGVAVVRVAVYIRHARCHACRVCASLRERVRLCVVV